MTKAKPGHRERIVDQFTRNAALFATAPQITHEAALKLLVDLAGAGPKDTVLDVACGPGLVVCAFAAVVREATGIDLTPAMIEQARGLQREKKLSNVAWRVGDVLPLPFRDGSFSIVTSRYAFHHLENPSAVMAEMERVCAPGGRVLLADVCASSDPAKAAAFNRMECLRDPSHVRAMPVVELEELCRGVGLSPVRRSFYGVEFELESLLQGSAPCSGSAELIRRMFVEQLLRDAMGVKTRRDGAEIFLTYPIAVLVAEKHASA